MKLLNEPQAGGGGGPWLLSPLLALCMVAHTTRAVELHVSDDTFVNTAARNTVYGKSAALRVGPNHRTFIKFDFSSLPAGTTDAHIGKATLRLWPHSVSRAGTLALGYPTFTWSESTAKAANAPATAELLLETISVSERRKFLTIDVTALVRSWLSGALPNHGIVLESADSNRAVISFDSKENTATGHEPTIHVQLSSLGSEGPGGPPSPGFTFRGNHTLGGSYAANDVVVFEGAAYLALNATTATPGASSDWALLAGAGGPGDPTDGIPPSLNATATPNVFARIAGPPAPLRLAALGDSMIDGVWYQISQHLNARLGRNGGLGRGRWGQFIYDPAQAEQVTDKSVWQTVILRISEPKPIIRFCTTEPTPIICDTFKLYYLTRPGGGTFKVQTKVVDGEWTDEPSYLAVSTDAPLSGRVITFTKPVAGHELRAVHVSGDFCDILGGALFNSTSRGVAEISLDVGGESLVDFLAPPPEVRNPIYADMAPDAVLMEWRDSPESMAVDLPRFIEFRNEVWPNTDVVLIGTTPAIDNDPGAIAQNRVSAKAAVAENWPYFDAFSLFSPYSAALERGWLYPNDVHRTAAGHEFLASQLLRWLGWYDQILLYQR